MILIDSSVLIQFFRSRSKVQTLFYKLARKYKSLSISAITYYEVGIGNRKSHLEYWETLTDCFTILPFNKECSLIAINIYFDLLKKNKLIDLADIFIGENGNFQQITNGNLEYQTFRKNT